MTEIDVLDPVPEQLKLSSGTVVLVEDLKARQFFKFLRIITHGALPMVSDLSIFKMDSDMDTGEFGARLLSLMILSIPDAEDESVDFIRAMVKPYGLIEGGLRGLNKVDKERNEELWRRVDADLENPELDDLITIIEAVVKREAADIQALGKRLGAMFKMAEKTGQVPSSPTASTRASSADSPAPSISSRRSTSGRTRSSETSPSVASVSVSLPSESVVSTSSGSGSNG